MSLDGERHNSPVSVLVIYVHGLLGEGIAAHLRDHGFHAVVVDCRDLPAVAGALAQRPSVVIAETTTSECHDVIKSISPGSRVVDVSQVIGRGCPQAASVVRFDAILDALADTLPSQG